MMRVLMAMLAPAVALACNPVHDPPRTDTDKAEAFAQHSRWGNVADRERYRVIEVLPGGSCQTAVRFYEACSETFAQENWSQVEVAIVRSHPEADLDSTVPVLGRLGALGITGVSLPWQR